MSADQFIRILEIVIWPTVALVAILVIRPHLSTVLSSAKVKLSIAGVSIETTLPEIKQILEEQTGEPISIKHVEFLDSLQHDGARKYLSGIPSAERKFLRPLRNSGLILTVPRNSFLQDAQAIELSALGRLYLRAKATEVKKDT